jgi:cysteine-rich repeat protein
MKKRIKRAVMLSFLIAATVGASACLPPPGEACGDGWCAEGYRCASVDLTSTCIKSSCGDGVVEAGEACDDGNQNDDDDCLQACRLNTCGDGRVNLRTEGCDDGNGASGDGCDSNCTVTACGNGVVTAGEVCDDGNGNDYDGCNSDCTLSPPAYVKASNTGAGDSFGSSIALSADGSTLAVGTPYEASAATGVGGDQGDNSAPSAGAVYIFTRSGTMWTQQAYLKASVTGAGDQFGSSVALSADGSTLVVGAPHEDSAAVDINGDPYNDWFYGAGAAYVFTRSGTMWSQQAYVKAFNTNSWDLFGSSVALSADGSTLAVGAHGEDSAGTGVNGYYQSDNSASEAGAVYVFTRSGTTWSQQAYIKASNTDRVDYFGWSVALSADGSTLAVGAVLEASAATGIDGDQLDNSARGAGAVYVFARSGTTWSQQAYVKASNTGVSQSDSYDQFGSDIALSADGSTLAVGAVYEDSAATGIDGDQVDNSASDAGAVYVFTRSGTTWSQQAYVKASNTGARDWFGWSIALSADGSILAVGATQEDSAATGLGGIQADNTAEDAGAVYVFTRSGRTWSQQAYLKASNTDRGDNFSSSIALSADASTLAVGALYEDSAATGIGGDQANNSAGGAGAVYVFRPRAWLP